MKKLILTVCVLLCFTQGALAAKRELHKKQIESFAIAQEIGDNIWAFNQTWPRTIMAIMYQESHANHPRFYTNGVVVGDKDNHGRPKSLGPMQVQVPTARDVFRWYPKVKEAKFGSYEPTDEEIAIALLTDIRFNILVGGNYFKHMLEYNNGDVDAAILAYNRGPAGVGDLNDYVRKVRLWMTTVVTDYRFKRYVRGQGK